jgi:predicted ATPase
LLRDRVNDPTFDQYTLWLTAFLCELGEACVMAGETAMGFSVIDRGLERTERLEENWCRAEFLHLKARLTLQRGLTNAAAATEALLKQSLDVATEQSTLSWRLRTATTLAKLWRDQGRMREARDLLTSVYDSFTEGFSTSDLRASRDLIRQLE